MPSSYFTSLPPGLNSEQCLLWARREHVANCAVEFLITHNRPLEGPILTHLQHYVNGEISLGQAIGRIVDHLAQSPGRT
ncbi:hypothetical protein IC235_20480 [Hymenobacter sp. BT664]|uniref:Antitoxin VbhA domain-containing protein n=1 Tax=Hymenobacter montanus TaxID=2771359 RepID=A0A927BG52_9BACT|nr:hypothetical protein [Hymenobacter montanus]MBD2770270.1 hypothetical protein [Hymenobacter montanus]